MVEDKKEICGMFTFCGGAVDSQWVFPHGTSQLAKDEAHRRINDFAPGGGFEFTSVHNVQSEVSAENYLALWEAHQE